MEYLANIIVYSLLPVPITQALESVVRVVLSKFHSIKFHLLLLSLVATSLRSVCTLSYAKAIWCFLLKWGLLMFKLI